MIHKTHIFHTKYLYLNTKLLYTEKNLKFLYIYFLKRLKNITEQWQKCDKIYEIMYNYIIYNIYNKCIYH